MVRSLRAASFGGGVSVGIALGALDYDDDTFSYGGNDKGAMTYLVPIIFVSALCIFVGCGLYCQRRSYNVRSAAPLQPTAAAAAHPLRLQLPPTSLPSDSSPKAEDAAVIKHFEHIKKRLDQVGLQKVLHVQDIESDNRGAAARATVVAKDYSGEPHASKLFMDRKQDPNSSNQIIRLTSTQTVHNCCAICQSDYQVGETVVWSDNPACRHAFHRDCMLDWLAKIPAAGSEQCPCCRQKFIDLQ